MCSIPLFISKITYVKLIDNYIKHHKGDTFVTYQHGKNLICKSTIEIFISVTFILALPSNVVNTSNNQKLGSAFDNLNPRLSFLCQVDDDVIPPAKYAGDARCMSQ